MSDGICCLLCLAKSENGSGIVRVHPLVSRYLVFSPERDTILIVVVIVEIISMQVNINFAIYGFEQKNVKTCNAQAFRKTMLKKTGSISGSDQTHFVMGISTTSSLS